MPTTTFECCNTLCKPSDPYRYCPDCGLNDMDICVPLGHFCHRCGHELARFDKDIIDRAAAKALETPIGQKINFAEAFGFDKEQ